MRSARPLWRRRLWGPFLLLVVLNVVAAAGYTLPRTLQLRNAARRVAAARAELEREREQVALLRERARAIAANRRDAKRFYAEMASSGSPALLPVLEEVERMARAPGLKPGRRSYARSPVKDAPLERVRISLPLEGSYDQLVGFLAEVERSPLFLTVDRVSLHGGVESVATLQVEMSTFRRAGGRTERGD